ncbi:MAG: hypothetical protein WAZ98_03075 [Cyclobacteriaceae bacterium]
MKNEIPYKYQINFFAIMLNLPTSDKLVSASVPQKTLKRVQGDIRIPLETQSLALKANSFN